MPALMPVPNSLPWMESVDAKYSRAEEHFQSFVTEALAFSRGVEHNVVLKQSLRPAKNGWSFGTPIRSLRFASVFWPAMFFSTSEP
jgi:hypothetical protein